MCGELAFVFAEQVGDLKARGPQSRRSLIDNSFRLGGLDALIHNGSAIAVDAFCDDFSALAFLNRKVAVIAVLAFAVIDAAAGQLGQCS